MVNSNKRYWTQTKEHFNTFNWSRFKNQLSGYCLFKDENSGEKIRKENLQNGAKFRHLKDPFFILCCNTKAYRIIQDRREDPFHWSPLDCTHKMTNNYIQVVFFFSVATSTTTSALHRLACMVSLLSRSCHSSLQMSEYHVEENKHRNTKHVRRR